MIHANMAGAIHMLWSTTWHAMIVWCLLAPLAAALSYFALVPSFRRALHRHTQHAAEPA
jgi:hypothetical protein